jgi:trehalose/maltose transport system substrate-binding protein
MLVVAIGPAAAQEGEVNCFTEDEAEIVMIAGAVGQENEIIREAAAAFMEACPNISVEIIEGPDSSTDRLGLYLQNFEAGSPDIDVYQIDVIWPGILADHLIDLGEYLTEDEAAAHFPAIYQNNTVDGRLVGIPWFTDAGLLYYRPDLLEKYGLDVPGTWDELEEAAMVVQEGERAEGNEDFWGYVWQGNAYEGLTCDALEWQFAESDTEIINPETGEIEVYNDETIAAFERAAGWVGTISPDGVTGYQEEDARSVWHAGNAAFMRNWPYAYSLSLQSEALGEGKVGVAALPFGASGHGSATLGGWQIAVSKYSENPDAAAAFAVYVTSTQEQKRRAIKGSFNPTIMSLYEDEEVLEAVPFFGSLYDVFINAVARPSTITSDKYNEVSTAYFTAVHSILTGDEDADTALTLLELDLEEILAE